MYLYVICAGICVFIILNVIMAIKSIKQKSISEIYIHTGLTIFLGLIVLEWIPGTFKTWAQFDILWLRVIGFVLFVPSAYLVASTIYALKKHGKLETAILDTTTALVDTGIFGVIRQPMTLGMAIWSIALIFVFQSILSVSLGLLSLFCFWMSAREEATYNIDKFGDDYRAYMKRVPMWNVFGVMWQEKGEKLV